MIMALAALSVIQPAPDIQLRVDVTARSVTIESQGEARIAVSALPDGGSTVETSGTRSSNRWTLSVDARIADALAGEQSQASDKATASSDAR